MLRGPRRLALARDRRNELLAVGGLFLVTALYLCIQAARVKSYIWLVDEFLYSKAAQGFAQGTLHPQVFSVHTSVPNVLYPFLLALPYALLSNVHAFAVGHLFNGLVFATAVVPLYGTARLLGATRGWSLFAAALGVWIPWVVAVNVLMSESLAYAAFCWALLAIVAALASARPLLELVALVLIVVAALARNQLVVLLPVFFIALVLHEVSWPRATRTELRERLRGHWVAGAGLVVGLIVLLATGSSVLGNYSFTSHYARFPKDLAASMADHLGHIIVGCGVVPAILWALTVVRGGTAPVRRSEHVFALVSGLTIVLIVYQAGFFSLQIAGGALQERYAFYVVALFAVGAGVALSERVRRTSAAGPIAAAVIAALFVGSANYGVGLDAFGTLLSAASGYDTELTKAVVKLEPSWTAAGGLVFATLVLGVVTAAVLTIPRVRRIGAPLLAGLVLLFTVSETHTVMNRVISGINSRYPQELATAPKSWVDGLLYNTSDDAGALELARDGTESDLWIWTEFWNTRIVRRYYIAGRPTASDNQPRDVMTLDPATGRLKTRFEEPLLVVLASDPTLSVRGQPIRTTAAGQTLLRPARPYQADWAYGTAIGSNTLAPKPTPLSLYPPNASVHTAHVSFQLTGTPGKPVGWTVNGGSQRMTGRLGGAAKRQVTLEVTPPAGAQRAVVNLSAAKTGRVTIDNVRVSWS